MSHLPVCTDTIYGNNIIGCPWCKSVVHVDECDVLGADDDAVFCPECSREFLLMDKKEQAND
jgi:predicted  nucleic acid-binding Zn-ribbon protein